MSREETFEQAVARIRKLTEVERPVASKAGFIFGQRVRVLEDDEDNGIFAGDEGWLVIEEVGAAEYHNIRTVLGFLADGLDCANTIASDNLEPMD